MLLWIVTTAGAQEVPTFSGYVNDYANLLTDATTQELEERLRSHEERTTNQVTVLTVPSLEGGNLEEFSLRVAEALKVGQGGKDNGILLLVARDDRKIRIEVGYGLEPYLPDAYASRIIREVIAPYFKQGDYNAGIAAGVNAILEKVEGIDELSEREVVQQDQGFGFGTILLGIFSAIVGFFIIKKRRRNAPRKSKKTGLPMKKLSEKEEDVHLSRGAAGRGRNRFGRLRRVDIGQARRRDDAGLPKHAVEVFGVSQLRVPHLLPCQQQNPTQRHLRAQR